MKTRQDRRAFMVSLGAGAIGSSLSTVPFPEARGKAQGTQNRGDRKLVILIDDCSGLLYSRPGDMTLRQWEERVDVLFSAAADYLSVDMAIPDLCNYGSKVEEYWGQHWDWTKPVSLSFYNIHRNIKNLVEAGNDPLEVLVARAHRAGQKLLAGIRMNDSHRHEFMRTRWETEHRAWSLDPMGRQMDYEIPQVREHRLAVIRELVEDYDTDGLILQFIRTPPFFSPPADQKAPIMTDYLRQIRDVLSQTARHRGKEKMVLGAILPWDLQICKAEGLDAAAWISEGLLDFVCPAEQHYTNWNMPVEQWKRLTEGTDCALCPTLHGDVASRNVWRETDHEIYGDNVFLSMEHIWACAENYYAGGADGISFFNFYEYAHSPKYPFLRKLHEVENLKEQDRHYFFIRNNEIDSSFGGKRENFYLELPLLSAERKTFRFRLGADLSQSKHWLIFKATNMTLEDELLVDLNGSVIPRENLVFHDFFHYYQPWLLFLQWETLLHSPPMRKGENEIGFKLLRRNARVAEPISIREIEVWVCPARTHHPPGRPDLIPWKQPDLKAR